MNIAACGPSSLDSGSSCLKYLTEYTFAEINSQPDLVLSGTE